MNYDDMGSKLEPEDFIQIMGLDKADEYQYIIQKRESDTAQRLAFLSLRMLGGYLLLHYGATVCIGIWGPDNLLASLKDIFSAALPVLSGLAGSAATYFFTKNKT